MLGSAGVGDLVCFSVYYGAGEASYVVVAGIDVEFVWFDAVSD